MKMTDKLICAMLLLAQMWMAGTVLAADSKEAQRAEIRKSSQSILNQLYKIQPSARKVVDASVGYAVFSNFGMKIFFAGGGSGHGLVFDKATQRETFMKMVEVQAGLGLGVKKFKAVFVFQDKEKLNAFVNSGWEATAQTTAAAIDGNKGMSIQGAVSVSPGVWVYQITDQGLALDATIKGTKYYKNDELN